MSGHHRSTSFNALTKKEETLVLPQIGQNNSSNSHNRLPNYVSPPRIKKPKALKHKQSEEKSEPPKRKLRLKPPLPIEARIPLDLSELLSHNDHSRSTISNHFTPHHGRIESSSFKPNESKTSLAKSSHSLNVSPDHKNNSKTFLQRGTPSSQKILEALAKKDRPTENNFSYPSAHALVRAPRSPRRSIADSDSSHASNLLRANKENPMFFGRLPNPKPKYSSYDSNSDSSKRFADTPKWHFGKIEKPLSEYISITAGINNTEPSSSYKHHSKQKSFVIFIFLGRESNHRKLSMNSHSSKLSVPKSDENSGKGSSKPKSSVKSTLSPEPKKEEEENQNSTPKIQIITQTEETPEQLLEIPCSPIGKSLDHIPLTSLQIEQQEIIDQSLDANPLRASKEVSNTSQRSHHSKKSVSPVPSLRNSTAEESDHEFESKTPSNCSPSKNSLDGKSPMAKKKRINGEFTKLMSIISEDSTKSDPSGKDYKKSRTMTEPGTSEESPQSDKLSNPELPNSLSKVGPRRPIRALQHTPASPSNFSAFARTNSLNQGEINLIENLSPEDVPKDIKTGSPKLIFSADGATFFNVDENTQLARDAKTPGALRRARKKKLCDKTLAELKRDVSPVMVNYYDSYDTRIIQPRFMEYIGSMCTTELWSNQTKKDYFMRMRGFAQVTKSLMEIGGEGLYRPEKMREKKAFLNKLDIEREGLTKELKVVNEKTKREGDGEEEKALNLPPILQRGKV